MELKDIIKKWVFFFYALDVNRDGVLEPADMDEIIDRLVAAKPDQFTKSEVNHLRYVTLKNFDKLLIEATKGKGRKINILEWVNIIRKTNDADKESYFIRWFSISAVRFLFDLFDQNGDGVIDFDEFEALYRILGLNRANIIFAFKQLDVNKDGVLSKSELYEAINNYFSSSNATVENYTFGHYKTLSSDYFNKLIAVLD
ncbi:EF-hand domain-containing protein [Ekhidna sp. To15]|uniref:EF-hand domain-containing protein n=1 Tax=Ekhidna sp. To15 TaxID=3395267 RepID=UPI003F51D3A0